MAKPRNRATDYLVYLALRLFAMFVHMLPMRANYAAAAFVGDMVYRLDKRHRERALENLRASFPDLAPEAHERLARESLRSLMFLGLETLFSTRLITLRSWRRFVRLNDMHRAISLLLRPPGGLIFVTGHLGNFEVLGYTLATLGFPTVSVARPLDNTYVNDWLMGVRERNGQSILYKKGATQSIDEILQGGGAVGFIADQDAGRKGAFVSFFGRPASTFKAPALMAMRHRVPIVVGFGLRRSRDFDFEIGIERVISPADWDDKPDPMMWITQQYTRSLEDLVRRTPEQYLWAHRRWKHQPPSRQHVQGGA
jgi:KDO2-lipid IV(A) lauroyltransferase